MYNQYVEWCQIAIINPVKEHFYRHIFNTKFNLSFHRPHTDTCSRCDKWENVMKYETDALTIEKNRTEKESHLQKAEAVAAQTAKLNVIKEAERNEALVPIVFDLQKPLPTLVLTANKSFYGRQLWTYKFCIHDLHQGQGNMFMWHEGVASRGCEEIASYLLKYILALPPQHKANCCIQRQLWGAKQKSPYC